MPGFFERYQQGSHEEVYNELVALQEKVFDGAVYADALSVAHEMMKRVRFNLEELLIPRLKQMGYRFGDGSWDHPGHLSDEELLRIQEEEPIFQSPTSDTSNQIAALEQIVGRLPLSLQCWYQDVGAVNFIGSFRLPTSRYAKKQAYKLGYGLDPLHTQPLLDVVEEIRSFGGEVDEQDVLTLPISPDGDFKYGYSGGGDYAIAVPCKAFDGLLLGERHNTTFVHYLRLCLHWGGFPGFEQEHHISQSELDYLTKDLLPF